jgi:predicted KAP-like P-loop ATPase
VGGEIVTQNAVVGYSIDEITVNERKAMVIRSANNRDTFTVNDVITDSNIIIKTQTNPNSKHNKTYDRIRDTIVTLISNNILEKVEEGTYKKAEQLLIS